MADRVRQEGRERRRTYRGGMSTDKAPIIIRLRRAIGEALQQPDLVVRPASQLELAIATFAPSTVVKGYRISDYPFPGCRYVSVRDGHVYHVKGASDDGEKIIAYRQGFLTSLLTHKAGLGVSIGDEGWMGSVMIMYSLKHLEFKMKGAVLESINAERATRQSYPLKRAGAFVEFLRRKAVRWPLVQNMVALFVR
jgi:hypothetical protein